MSRTKGAKNKKKNISKVKDLKPEFIEKAVKKYAGKKILAIKRKYNYKRCNIMKNLQDVLDATTALSTAIDTLIQGIGNIKSVDLTPAVDAINAVTAKIQAIQLPTA